MNLQSPHPDRDYWIAMGMFTVCTLFCIHLIHNVGYPESQFRFWLGYLTSDRPALRQLAVSEFRQESEALLPLLLHKIASADTNDQAQAVMVFAAMDGHARPAIPKLAKLLHHETSSLAVARALGGIGRSSLPVLTNALHSPVRFVRSNATRGIGLLHSDGRVAVPLLVKALEDRDDDLRYFASRALGHIAAEPEQAVPALVGRFDDPSLEVRRIAIVSLGKFHEHAKAAVPALRQKELWGANQEIRDAAAFALKEIDPTASASGSGNELPIKPSPPVKPGS